ncbi:GNAT family N-acetyltransferase [Chitinimonas taiwanensis]|jgi:ElaA protein|uniref:ElaA protein n=1 Tax=Chitinimonas taiwanensis DSM 18899 TaxID=1121279 RepID=A0A1K2H4E7_9NEIS|nr:GNAT family N-acetyltransferase [Chitinimonas taiwanensis]SFZ70204.1 ElaA protein [Chitinimonas taiwanensis DSM 18899]
MSLHWQWATLDALSAREWHEVGMLRQAVFIVEQRCAFPDLDELDLNSLHLLGRNDAGELWAYLRLVPPGGKYDTPSIGRVVTASAARGSGAGRALMLEGMAEHQRRYPGQPNTIGGQAYLNAFYESLGFETISEVYLEDDIEHYHMRWTPPA